MFGKGSGKMFPKINGLSFCVFHLYAVLLCASMLPRIPAVRSICHYDINVDPRGTNVDYDVMGARACDGGMFGSEHSERVTRVPRDPGIEPELNVSSCRGIRVRNNSSIITRLCSAALAGPSFL